MWYTGKFLVQLQSVADVLSKSLDRQTSGLVIFARNKIDAKILSDKFQQRQVRKTYVARVYGRFPSETVVCHQRLIFDEHDCIGSCSESGKEATTVSLGLSLNTLLILQTIDF